MRPNGWINAVLVAVNTRRLRSDLDPSWPILALPLVFHSLCWFALFATGEYLTGERATLLVSIPMFGAIGFLGFGWASLDRLSPRAEDMTAPAE